jgi:hypothetical protein
MEMQIGLKSAVEFQKRLWCQFLAHRGVEPVQFAWPAKVSCDMVRSYRDSDLFELGLSWDLSYHALYFKNTVAHVVLI